MDDIDSILTVADVADLLRGQFAIISGGKSKEGRPIITFPDLGNFCSLADEGYQKLILYLTSVPSLDEADVGFVLVIDRRNDKWNSVKTVLLKLSGYFPGIIHVAYVLRPSGFLQKAISEVSSKLFREEFRFKVVVCDCVEELHEYIEKNQLTKDLDGCIPYNHEEWIEQRVALEKFSNNTHEVSTNLDDFTRRLQETAFPNDVDSTEELLEMQGREYRVLKDEILGAARHGETLLTQLRGCTTVPNSCNTLPNHSEDALPTEQPGFEAYRTCPDRLLNVTAVERLLVQLEETERTFDDFWSIHSTRLRQCLELRKFEYDFRELQASLDAAARQLAETTEVGESVVKVEGLLREASLLEGRITRELDRAGEVCAQGEALVAGNHYAHDSILPKCLELERMASDVSERLEKRLRLLRKCLDLQERVEKANDWCSKGVHLLASMRIEKCSSPEFAEQTLSDLECFLASYEGKVVPKRSSCSGADLEQNSPWGLFADVVTPETKALVQQVVQRIEDVHLMCEKRRVSLRRLSEKPPPRPVQTVTPEPGVPLQQPMAQSWSEDGHLLGANPQQGGKDQRLQLCTKDGGAEGEIEPVVVELDNAQPNNNGLDSSSGAEVPSPPPSSSATSVEGSGSNNSARKCNRILAELLDTERIYVSELASILKGYKDEMLSAELQPLVPSALFGKSDVLFGNLEDLHRFHSEMFLRDLENCISTVELVGLCFVQRREAFHRLYSHYCQNIPRSEALRHAVGEQNPFFVECRRRLGHRLPLGAYLLKPVQRVTKYQLLLKDLLRHTSDCNSDAEEGEIVSQYKGHNEIREALDCMLAVLKCVNDSMHQISITGFWGSLAEQGELLLQGEFAVWAEGGARRKRDRLRDLRLKPMRRYLFLYERSLLFCKKVGGGRRGPKDEPTYHFKRHLEMSRIGLTESVRGWKGGGADERKFEVWVEGRREVYVIQAASRAQKEAWVRALKRLLLSQLHFLRGESMRRHSGIQPHTAPPHIGVKDGMPNGTFGEGGDQRPLHHTFSWEHHASEEEPDLESEVTRQVRLLSCDGERRVRKLTDGDGEDESGWWSSDCSNSEDDEDPFPEPSEGVVSQRYAALADYCAVGGSEVSMREGDIVQLLKVGCAGWWYVRILGCRHEGWAPSAYLELVSGAAARAARSSLGAEAAESLANATGAPR
ncbi:guanine nucleotide exchange factor DBS-like [Ischnura elegans]|uniref:guanine nucleotide exchange factor DBS-like n=1 Tax=Ischnura elegans TaxID=197161 RepID=UPI001ED8A58E|nr:guanine nucleotide exchange factor DBS-like [Ischnura elegans]